MQRACVDFEMQHSISAEMAVLQFFEKVLKFSEYESWPANKGFWILLDESVSLSRTHGIHNQRHDGKSVKLVALFVKFFVVQTLELPLLSSNRFIFFPGG